MTRRPKYRPEVVQRICQAVALGATYELACRYGGITRETLNQWRKGKPDFSDALQRAEGEAAVGWLAKIEQAAAAGAWQAAAWKLERRYPEDYGRSVQQLEHSGTVVQEHTGSLEVRALDYRQAIRPLRPPELEDTAG